MHGDLPAGHMILLRMSVDTYTRKPGSCHLCVCFRFLFLCMLDGVLLVRIGVFQQNMLTTSQHDKPNEPKTRLIE